VAAGGHPPSHAGSGRRFITGRPNPSQMARKRDEGAARIVLLEREIDRLTRAVREAEARAAVERDRVGRLERAMAARERRERLLLEALGLRPRSRPGDRGRLGEVQNSVVGLQEYLLKTGDRIDRILTALKEHREFLLQLDKRVLQTGTRDRIRLELDIMKNTLSILSLAGVEVDEDLPKEIENVRAAASKAGESVEDLRKTKEALDRRYEEELKRFDLEAIWAKRREIPGYR
jgi:hypothetical protein